MAKKQAELPGTRRDDEPPPAKSIAALDDACDVLEKAKGKAIKAGQGIVEAKHQVDSLLREHGINAYTYETANGVEKKVFISESIKTAKIKKAKADDGGDE
jgi:thiamine pyrophosphate-dependent acetolactate synthase large subunit-like protein